MAYQFSMRSSVRRRSQKCVSTVGQDGTDLHVDAHGQHSQKCVHCGSRRHRIARRRSRSTLTEVCVHCGSRRHRIARRRSRSTLTEVCVHCGSRRHRFARRRSRSTLTEVCVHCGSRRHAYIWLVPHTRHMGSKPDSVRSLGVSNRADHIKVVDSMSDVHGFRKHIAVCFHIGWTVLVPCTELGNVGVHSSV